ncbi:MAG: LytTR family DNA-binding domain-containing protein [Bacteroidales bacterium]|nr:LytTR family DNA-binding domain-containing protein [Bacteroidales bacterium]
MDRDKITSIVVDDEPLALERMEHLLQNCDVVDNCQSIDEPDKVLEAVERHNPEIIFLDIEMPRKSGFEVVKEVRSAGYNPYIIFVTAFNQYAIKAIKTGVFDYILKPVDLDNLKASIHRYIDHVRNIPEQDHEALKNQPDKPRIRFNTRTGFAYVDPEELLYCEASGAYTNLLLNTNKKLVTSTYLSDVEKHLPAEQFLRISRSLLINSKYLTEFDRAKRVCVLSDGEQEIPLKVSKRYMGALKDV